MRIRWRLISTILLCLVTLAAATPAIVRADVSRFINEQTVLAAEADLTKLDAAATDAFLMELAKAAGIVGPNPMQMKEDQAKANLGQGTKWINDVKQAGATSIYLIVDSATMQRTGPTMIIPVPDEKAAAVAKLIPAPAPPPPNQRRNDQNLPQAVTVPGVGVMWGAPASVNATKALKPAPRADLAAAFKQAGAAPIKVAFALDDKMRQEITQNAPPMIMGKPTTLITKDFQWLSVAATPPPNMTIKAVAQSTDATSAKATDELIVSAIVMNQQSPNKLPDELITLLTPQVQGNQLVLSLDARQINQLAVAIKEPLMRGRQAALRVQSASQIRQMLMAAHMHATDNKGQWPADMKELEKALARYARPGFKQLLTNPARPEAQPGYVYIKPAKGLAGTPHETVVMYESHKAFADGVNVGFADAHVEWVADKRRFDELLAKTAQEQEQ